MSNLMKNSILKGKIKLITGLHIGGGTEALEIGGIDNSVIKDPRTKYPYIPGSSLKGKIRCLLELKYGIKSPKKENPCSCGECDICKAFGNTASSSKVGVTRLVFRDSFLSEESQKELSVKNLLATDAKIENAINRLRGVAEHPRTMERAIPGLIFDFEVIIRIFENDGDVAINLLKEGMMLLQKDALGGSGSRGYGKIEFLDLKLDGNEFKLG